VSQTIFAKGANWVPPDSLHARVSDEALCEYLESARESNFNFIRTFSLKTPQNGQTRLLSSLHAHRIATLVRWLIWKQACI
jgi:beta-galactosidase/beta-glucuronidase